ncbi:hypothetical protein LINPERHAP1_LOCUS23169 [Linum perenne]
MGCCRFLIQ